MRAMHEFAHGDLAGMLSRNILVPIGLVLLPGRGCPGSTVDSAHARVPALRPPVPVLYGSIVVLVLFAVLRNLPMSPFSGLAP